MPNFWQRAVFTLTTFLSAFLLFQVQLIISKHILPWFGGTAAVWTTCMLVFQVLLLAGYIYSHRLVSRFPENQQSVLHVALLGGALLLVVLLSLAWPSAVTPGASWRPSGNTKPILGVAFLILASTGLPFFALSTTGPLLQGWYARLGGGHATYRLYAVSNAGSLLGLLSFPFVLEPYFDLTSLGKAWAFLFACFVLGCALCAWWSHQAAGVRHAAEGKAEARLEVPASSPRGLWFLLAACASGLLLAATNLLCQEVASLPLLWVLPLATYLLTFILAFGSARWYSRAIFQTLFFFGGIATCIALLYQGSLRGEVVITITLFSAWMICHGELARLKPAVHGLTSFYLAISAGGAAGGILVAVLAPMVLRSFLDFQLCMAGVAVLSVACMIYDSNSWLYDRKPVLPAAILAVLLLGGWVIYRWNPDLHKYLVRLQYYPLLVLIGAVCVAGSYLWRPPQSTHGRGFRFVQPMAGFVLVILFTFLYWSSLPVTALALSERNFYGVIQILQSKHGRVLMHGRTIHGSQLNPPFDRVPLAYYGPESGIGVALAKFPRPANGEGPLQIGVVGLGAGSLATYGRPGDTIHFYELDPAIAALSMGPHPEFTFLRDSPARVDVKVGDGRLLLEDELAHGARTQFDVLVLDAFSGDAIPVHLLTREAFDEYWQCLNASRGILAVHISSRHVNLLPVVAGVARHYQVPLMLVNNVAKDPYMSSSWVLLAKNADVLRALGTGQVLRPEETGEEGVLWTDERSDVARLLR
ncbi:MAG: hypothetical protein P4M01_03500 [Acidobacteriota bacterium]|nr:hypothetical protein [Acidobacteriota bacterium]